jgi:hypothetical protein
MRKFGAISIIAATPAVRPRTAPDCTVGLPLLLQPQPRLQAPWRRRLDRTFCALKRPGARRGEKRVKWGRRFAEPANADWCRRRVGSHLSYDNAPGSASTLTMGLWDIRQNKAAVSALLMNDLILHSCPDERIPGRGSRGERLYRPSCCQIRRGAISAKFSFGKPRSRAPRLSRRDAPT